MSRDRRGGVERTRKVPESFIVEEWNLWSENLNTNLGKEEAALLVWKEDLLHRMTVP